MELVEVDDVTSAYIHKRLDYLMGSRPTAVDLANAIRLLKRAVQLPIPADQAGSISAFIREVYTKTAEKILEDDLATNLAIGRYGAEFLRRLASLMSRSSLSQCTYFPLGYSHPYRLYRPAMASLVH